MSNEPAVKIDEEDSKDLKILAALRSPATATDVIASTGLSKPTVYRRLKTLELSGLIYRAEGIYGCGAAGLAALASNKMSDLRRPASRVWPWLDELPLPEFRSFATLVLFAVMARRANIGEDRNPGFVAFGPTQRLKSWLIKILCYLAGSAPELCQLPMQSVRARGLIGRLDGQGTLGDTNPVLQQPIVWLEEASLAETGVYRDVAALLQGSRIVKIEGHEIDIPAVPIIEMNPRTESGDLENRTGLDIPRLRRVITLDFARLEITPVMRRNAKALGEHFKTIGPLRLDDAPRTPLSMAATMLLDRAIAACVRPESQDYVDVGRLATLVLGGRAVLSDMDAVTETVWCWAECMATLGFLMPQWRTLLAEVFLDPTGVAAEMMEPNASPPTAAISKAVEFQQEPQVFNKYQLDDVLMELNNKINQAGLRIPEDHFAIKSILQVTAILKRNEVVAKQLMDLVKLSKNLEKHNLNLEHINDAFAGHRSRDLSQKRDKEFWILWSLLVHMGLSDADAAGFSATVFDVIGKRVLGEEEDRSLINITMNGVDYSFTVDRHPKSVR